MTRPQRSTGSPTPLLRAPYCRASLRIFLTCSARQPRTSLTEGDGILRTATDVRVSRGCHPRRIHDAKLESPLRAAAPRRLSHSPCSHLSFGPSGVPLASAAVLTGWCPPLL